MYVYCKFYKFLIAAARRYPKRERSLRFGDIQNPTVRRYFISTKPNGNNMTYIYIEFTLHIFNVLVYVYIKYKQKWIDKCLFKIDKRYLSIQ